MMAGQSPLVEHHRCHKVAKDLREDLICGLHGYYSTLTIHDKWVSMRLWIERLSSFVFELFDNAVEVGSRVVYVFAILLIFAVQAIRALDDTESVFS